MDELLLTEWLGLDPAFEGVQPENDMDRIKPGRTWELALNLLFKLPEAIKRGLPIVVWAHKQHYAEYIIWRVQQFHKELVESGCDEYLEHLPPGFELPTMAPQSNNLRFEATFRWQDVFDIEWEAIGAEWLATATVKQPCIFEDRGSLVAVDHFFITHRMLPRLHHTVLTLNDVRWYLQWRFPGKQACAPQKLRVAIRAPASWAIRPPSA